jgi:hypothetical protein
MFFADVTGYRQTLERYGIGPWNQERILWLELGEAQFMFGREWNNSQYLQREIAKRLPGAVAEDRLDPDSPDSP